MKLVAVLRIGNQPPDDRDKKTPPSELPNLIRQQIEERCSILPRHCLNAADIGKNYLASIKS